MPPKNISIENEKKLRKKRVTKSKDNMTQSNTILNEDLQSSARINNINQNIDMDFEYAKMLSNMEVNELNPDLNYDLDYEYAKMLSNMEPNHNNIVLPSNRDIINLQDQEYEEALQIDTLKMQENQKNIVTNIEVKKEIEIEDKPLSREELRKARLVFFQKKNF